ncbi:thioredoxin domain-containing protein [Portibacter marinus]|uniref:thioredoxin domain-containing protein n=1 Tax=Portibacter marinus TaxID=2898660 RepID=UPI001F416F42|nr:thioredoxin domain-containing protein [Portibacter marinus]
MKKETSEQPNALINETSPYLLQHAYNPVDWHAWNENSIEKAKKEDKLLLISIGYSSCHWCHVMEHESFEDSTVAALMNDSFIPIKVDREERPDVDDIYMTACNLINGSGGWPLNAVALPDGRPIWAGTYFPKDQWIKILEQFKELKQNDYQKLVSSAEKLVSGLRQVDAVVDVSDDVEFNEEELKSIGQTFISTIDMVKGGRKGNQKFPLPNNYEFLLKYAYKYPDSKALEAVETTLNAMIKGGIYDQIEGGWSRYTVHNEWMVPHFEKMLYDNGQLVELYSEAFKLTKNVNYQSVVNESVQFIQENWKDDTGGYYSSYDADSEGEEGKFYVWTYDQLKSIIPADQFEFFVQYYNVEKDGNWEERNILYIDRDRSELDGNQIEWVTNWKKLLKDERAKRIYPGLDDKILCSWNALLLSGYTKAFEAFGHKEYRDEAISIWEFIETYLLQPDMRLNRNYKDGQSTINAFLDDYALTIRGLIHLYQITFEEKYLTLADQMTTYVLEHFSSSQSAMFNFTSDLDPPLVAQKSELTDGVIPSSNSVMARNLYHLGLFLYNEEYVDRAKQMLRNMKNTIVESKQPSFYSNWCNLYFEMIHEPFEVAIIGPEASNFRNQMLSYYHSNALFLGGEQEGNLKLLENKLQGEDTYIYVCVNKSCKLPVQEPEKAIMLMN